MTILSRVLCVAVQDLVLRRNPAGLLGFNVQQDGVITEVEPYGLASQAGLRQGARLVEVRCTGSYVCLFCGCLLG